MQPMFFSIIRILVISCCHFHVKGSGDPHENKSSNSVASVTINVAIMANTGNRMKRVAKAFEANSLYECIDYASAAQATGTFKGCGERTLHRLIDVQKSVDPRGVFKSKGL
jgi:hypothetical protein